MSLLKKSGPVYVAILKYNRKLESKLQISTIEIEKEKQEYQTIIDKIQSGAYGDTNSDSNSVFYLSMISMIYEHSQTLKEVIGIKNLVNQNSGKIMVVRSLLGNELNPNVSGISPTNLDDSMLDTFEDRMRSAEDTLADTEAEIKAIRAKIVHAEKEIKKIGRAHV